MPRGKLFVLEGIDGTGKGTQAQLLLARLRKEGFRAEKISFPQYGTPRAQFVEAYLNGKYGPAASLHPELASLFFAHDRQGALPGMLRQLDDGVCLVADRYVLSNAGHQGGKIADLADRKNFLDWLHQLEHETLGAIRPDLNIILTLDPAVAQRRVAKKAARAYLGGKEGAADGHESDANHLANAQNAYLWVAAQHPDAHAVIAGTEPDGRELNEAEVHDRVWNAVKDVLSK
jgi:dTMP kinase